MVTEAELRGLIHRNKRSIFYKIYLLGRQDASTEYLDQFQKQTNRLKEVMGAMPELPDIKDLPEGFK
jgi:hypothetical protein